MTFLASNIQGAGVFQAEFMSGSLQVAPGAAGNIIVITPPAGNRVRLTELATTAGTETGISMTVGAKNVVTSLDLESISTSTGAGEFKIGISDGTSNTAEILGDTDETVTIIKDAGNTTQTITYSYEYGI